MKALASRMILFVALMLSAEAFSSSPGLEGPVGDLHLSKFSVRHVKGQVLAWNPDGLNWDEVKKGDLLEKGVMLQVTVGASVSLATTRRTGQRHMAGIDAKEIVVNINTPMVIRLGNETFRSIKTNSLFLAAKPKNANGPTLEVPLNLNEAWQRFMAVMTRRTTESRDIFKLPTGEKAGVELAARAGRIEILSPVDGALFQTNHDPQPIRVTWEPRAELGPDERPEYEVFLWKEGELPPSPVARTFDHGYTLVLMSEGNYLLQIRSSDGTLQSPVQRLSLVLPLSAPLAAKKPSDHPKNAANPIVPLDFPPTDFTIVRSSAAADVLTQSFHWQRGIGLPSQVLYDLLIMDPSGKILEKVKTADTQASVKLRDGAYRWRIDAHVQSDVSATKTLQTLASETRSLKVSRSDPKATEIDSAVAALRLSLSQGINGTILVDDP